MDDVRVQRLAALPTEALDAVRRITSEVEVAEGTRPLSDQAMFDLDGGDVTHVLGWRGDALAGYAQLQRSRSTGTTAELAVASRDESTAPDHEVFDALIKELLAAADGDDVALWAHGEGSETTRLARDLGLHIGRTLLVMGRSLGDADPLPEPTWPADVTVRSFEVGKDEQAWLAVNNAAFAEHPEQSDWTMRHLAAREAEPWFDPAGFFLAERAGAVVGFHWTKVHPATSTTGSGLGEVYVIGVDPAMQGHRLGESLLLVGLAHLRSQGLPRVMLYVDETNTSAIALYERLGFRRQDADVCFIVDSHAPLRSNA